MFLKKSPVYSGIANQKDTKIIRDYHDPEGFPTTEFIFNLWCRNVTNVLMHAPVDILQLMFITYMHDFWVNTKCCQGKQYKVQIPQQNEFFQGMMTGEKEVEDYREMFQCITGDELLITKLRNDFTQCWNIHRGVPSCIHDRCISCDLGRKNNCNTCNWGTMCALEIVHRPEFWVCVWPNMFISTPIKLGGIPECSKIIFTCNMRSKKFQSWTEGDSHPSDIYLMGFAHLLCQCSQNRKSTTAEHDDECVHEKETTPVHPPPCTFTTDTSQVGTTPQTI